MEKYACFIPLGSPLFKILNIFYFNRQDLFFTRCVLSLNWFVEEAKHWLCSVLPTYKYGRLVEEGRNVVFHIVFSLYLS